MFWLIKIVNKAAAPSNQPLILDPHVLFPHAIGNS